MLVDVKGAGEAAKGMTARSRGVVRMMTRKSKLGKSGVWQTLGKKKKKDWSLASFKKKRKRKRELTHVYSHSHRLVHTSRHDGEKAWILTSSRTRWRIEGRKAQIQIFCQISRWLRGNLGKR
jgi:hypothetical protein